MEITKLAKIEGKYALVSGGAGYIGFTICETLCELGVKIIIADIDKKNGEKYSEILNEKFKNSTKFINCDLTSKNEIDKIVDYVENEYDSLDILINCASLVGTSEIKGWATKFENQEYEAFEKSLNINLTSTFYMIQKLKYHLHKAENPSIINISSIYGFAGQKMSMYKDMDYLTPAGYSASKGGLIQLTKYLASILSPQIRVNCISPGGIKNNQSKEFIKRYENITPMQRMGERDDIKGAIHFLSSNLSSYITGQNIIIDGGWSL